MKKSNRRNFLKASALGAAGITMMPSLTGAAKSNIDLPEEEKKLPLPKQPYNVIFLTCDELNTQAMSVYGNKLTTMPAAERMAEEGVLFERPYVQMPKCVPSRASMMTGRYPHCEGHRTLMGRLNYEPHEHVTRNWDFTLREDEPNLVKYLKDRGYKTALIGKNHLVDWNLHKKWFDFTSLWDSPEWKNRKNPYTDDTGEHMKKFSFRGKIKEELEDDEIADGMHANWTNQFIRENKDNPFFAVVDLQLPHPPYAEFTKMPSYKIPLEEIDNPPVLPLDDAPSVESAKRKTYDVEHFTDEDRKRVHRAYYTMCEFVDKCVGEILDELDRLDLAENTIFIYGSDHGDSNGIRNMFEKWDTCFYDEITQVPLMIRVPGKLPAGKRITNLVEYVDVVPTILELLGEEQPLWVQGKSLVSLAKGDTEEHKDAVFSQGGVERDALSRAAEYDRNGKIYWKQKVVHDSPESMIRSKMIRTDKWKYVYRLAGDCELYDMENDPKELNNLAYDEDYKDVINDMKARMLEFTIEYETNYPLIGELHT